MYGPSDEAESIATIHAAIDAGINLIDTGDFYGMGHNEMLIGRALEGRRDKVLLSVKFGAMRTPAGAFIGFDGRPEAVKNFVAYSLQRLRTDHIDIYRPSRLDRNVPIEETLGAIGELIKAGYVRFAGLSEMGAATMRRAQAAHPISDLQIEYSLVSRGIERGDSAGGARIRDRDHGLRCAFARPADRLASLPGRAISGRICRASAAATWSGTRQLVQALADLAAQRGATPVQVAIAWVLARATTSSPSSERARDGNWTTVSAQCG